MSNEVAPSELDDVKRKIKETEDELTRIKAAVRRKPDNHGKDDDEIAQIVYAMPAVVQLNRQLELLYQRLPPVQASAAPQPQPDALLKEMETMRLELKQTKGTMDMLIRQGNPRIIPLSHIVSLSTEKPDKRRLRKLHGFTCCVTGTDYRENKEHTQGHPMNVTVAHIVPLSHPEELEKANRSRPGRPVGMNSPKNTLLLVKWLEVLFDEGLWCIIPKQPLSSSSPLIVHVLVPENCPIDDIPPAARQYYTQEYKDRLSAFRTKETEIKVKVNPSMRCLSWHIVQCYAEAASKGWIPSAEYEFGMNVAGLSQGDDDGLYE